MSASTSTSSSGLGLCSILGIIFICAKVFEIAPIASWSWWWVLSPFWIGFLFFAAVLALIALVAGAIAIFSR